MTLLHGQTSSSHPVIQIGDYRYEVFYSNATLGQTFFVLDDDKDVRTIVLPESLDQRPVSLAHEMYHACMHNHLHKFSSEKELEKHLFQETYTEEEVVTMLSPCMIQGAVR
jgi:hypothetical protein